MAFSPAHDATIANAIPEQRAMNQLNLVATFAAATVLTIFGLTCWLFEGRPFDPPIKAEQAAALARQAETFGGMFGIRGPKSLHASVDGKQVPVDYEYLMPVNAVSR
jgi:hypothetical protein